LCNIQCKALDIGCVLT